MLDIITAILGLITCKSPENNKEDNERIQREINEIKLDVVLIKENHLHHIEKDIAEIKTDIKIILMKLN